MQNQLAKNTAIYALGDIIPKMLNLITVPILTTHLSTEDFGIVNYINSVELFLSILTFLGLKTYYLVYYYKVGGATEQKKLLGGLSILVLFFNLLLCSALMFIGPFLFRNIAQNISFYPYIFLGVIINFFSTFAVLPSALYRVRENPLPLTIINSLKGVLIMIGTIVVVRQFPTADVVLWVKVVVTVVFAVFFIFITFRNAVFSIDLSLFKKALAFSLPLVPGDVAYYFSTMSDRILIERYCSASILGIYSLAATLAGLLNIISYGAYRAFEPYFFKTYGKDSFLKDFEKVRDILLYVLLILGFCLAIFSREAIVIFAKPEYLEADNYVMPLVLGVIVNSLATMFSTVLTAQSKTKLCGFISVLSAVVSVGFNMLFLPKIGVWSAVLANILIFCLILILARYFSHISIKSIKPALAILLFIFASLCVNKYLCLPDLLLSILFKIIFVFLYIVLLSFVFKITPISLIKGLKR